MGFFGIGEGPSGHEIGENNLLNSTNAFATGLGEGNLTLSSEFFQNLLANPMKALAPEVSAGQNVIQQVANKNATFGNRSGGTNASTQAAGAANRTNLVDAAVGAQTGAASNLAAAGSNLLSTGQQGDIASFDQNKIMHDQSMQQLQDLISSSLQTAGGIVAGVPGAAGGAMDVGSNLLGSVG